MALEVTHYSDPVCPWAYSASPAHAVLRWRYGDQLTWRLVLIGLSEDPRVYASRGYSPARLARGYRSFRRYGMPFTTQPRSRLTASGRACRAIVAVRLEHPGRELSAFRALQLASFTTPLLLDEDADLVAALGGVDGIDPEAVVAAIDRPDVVAAYDADRAEARSAAGGATEFQGKAAVSDGFVRYTAPSLVFSGDAARLEAGGFQPVEAYDVLIANLDRSLSRRPAAESALEALAAFPDGLVTQEVAAIMAEGNSAPDRGRAEEALIDLVEAGEVTRSALGDDALWSAVDAADGRRAPVATATAA